MKVDRKSIIHCMEVAADAIGNEQSNTNTHHFKIYGKLLEAFNGILTIRVWMPIDLGLKCSVVAAPLLSILKTLSSDEVDLSLDSDGNLKLSAGNVKCKFATSPIAEQPQSPKDHLVGVQSDLFTPIVNGFDMCKLVIAKDNTAGPLCGVKINNKFIISTDRFRVMKYELGTDCGINCIVPAVFANVVSKYKGAISGIGFTKDKYMTVLLTDGTTITTVLISDKYPDLIKYFPDVKAEYCDIDFSNDVKESVDRWVKFLSGVDRANKEVTISVSGDKCLINAVDPLLGNLEEELTISGPTKADVKFFINPTLLKDMILRCSKFKYYTESHLVSFEGDKFNCLVQTRR